MKAAWILLSFAALHTAFAVPDPDPFARRAFGGLHPRVSPDGQRIVLSYHGTICTMPAGGGQLRRLSRGEGYDIEPAWSPDSGRIAFINAPSFGGGTLRVIDASTGTNIALPQTVRGSGPLWFAPDGKRVLGKFNLPEAKTGIAWCDLATGTLTPLAGVPESWAMRLRGVHALSPDGKWIYFAEHRDAEGEQSGNQGPQALLRRLPTEGGTPETICEWPARIYGLCVAADAGSVFLATDLGVSHNDVWQVPLSDSLRDARKLTFGQADEDAPSVSGSGDVMIYSDNAEGATALVRYDLKTGDRRTLSIESINFGEPMSPLQLRIVDKSSDNPAVARVSVRQEGGKFHFPVGAMHRHTAGVGHFYCRDSATLYLPVGKYELLAFRGPEYRMKQLAIEVKEGVEGTARLELERWTHAAAEGWFSGENHIHANYGYGSWYNSPRTILDQCEGEDLNVANLVAANSDSDAVFDREYFRGRLDALSTPRTLLWWNEEFRSTMWGHMTLFHLHSLVEPVFTGFKSTTNPWDVPTNAQIAQRAHSQGGTASYTHPASNMLDSYAAAYAAKGLPVDVVSGTIDMLDVMGWVYDPSLPLWYRLLNCGFHLPAAAGTDVFLNRVPSSPPGWGRVYVHVPDGLTYEKWVAGLRAGRSFISNGPMIELTVNDKAIGDTLTLDSPGKIRVKGRVRSQFPLEKLEIVLDGNVIANGTLAEDKLTAAIDAELPIERSGWIALRTAGPVVNRWPSHYGIRAHTNPVYLAIKDHPADARAEAEYFLKWIDRLEADLKRRDQIPPGDLEHVKTHLMLARNAYRALLKR
ncbi:CehA/McbA family metallohydrolase [Prosthecobacter sp.]|uniref:CehA/McbA family metallohydrolase n=1 Tax=Prosthecobacter sp. TaxID=1965333 RepID=UPI002ABBA281|nr:CehA/McbA family metallohydrolase [Prosthecobacter sp.]MDZ4402246.1 CehA/McbA family metallohydrolase [Prosthecobacter sp.]